MSKSSTILTLRGAHESPPLWELVPENPSFASYLINGHRRDIQNYYYFWISQDGQFTDIYWAFTMYQDLLKDNVIAEIVFLPNKAIVEVLQYSWEYPEMQLVSVEWGKEDRAVSFNHNITA